jgi:hypothetical protein
LGWGIFRQLNAYSPMPLFSETMQEISRLNGLIEHIDLELMVMDCTQAKFDKLTDERQRCETVKNQLIREFHMSND